MLKTAALTIGFCVLASGASAIETPKYDRKIERAAIERVAAKMGRLRQTLDAGVKFAAADLAPLPPNLDLTPTATVLVQPNEPRFPRPVRARRFTIFAGEYYR